MTEWMSSNGKVVLIEVRTMPMPGPNDPFRPERELETSAGDLALIYELRNSNSFVEDLLEIHVTGNFDCERLLPYFGGKPSHNAARRSAFIRDCKLALKVASQPEAAE